MLHGKSCIDTMIVNSNQIKCVFLYKLLFTRILPRYTTYLVNVKIISFLNSFDFQHENDNVKKLYEHFCFTCKVVLPKLAIT